MKIVIVASEAAPFAKTGGLADVAGALPKALFRLGHDPILVMPLYRQVRSSGIPLAQGGSFSLPVGRRTLTATLAEGEMPGTGSPVYFLDADGLFDRPCLYGEGHYGYPDNCERFATLSRGAIEAMRFLGISPDVFHVHDWQTALIPPYLKILYDRDVTVGRSATLLTIHNIAYQGVFWHWDMETIGIGWEHFNWKEFEFWGKVNLLKGGIVYADAVSTVSPTYAREIQAEPHGHGLDGVLRERRDALYGVVNGTDDAVWNPAADPHIHRTYGPEDLSGKAACKRALQRLMGLRQRKVPLAGIVSRFAEQKGLDLVCEALKVLLPRTSMQCVILGDGDFTIREELEVVAERHPEQLKVVSGYDEPLAHRIIAGSDIIMVPSRSEPCGLTQLYGLKYGSVPVVRRTGGLNDTVTDCTPETLEAGTGTGFVFDEPMPEALVEAVDRALALWRDRKAWTRLMRNGMRQDWSWEASARRYVDIYADAVRRRMIR